MDVWGLLYVLRVYLEVRVSINMISDELWQRQFDVWGGAPSFQLCHHVIPRTTLRVSAGAGAVVDVGVDAGVDAVLSSPTCKLLMMIKW